MTAVLILAPLILFAALGAAWKARPVHAALMLALALSLNAILYICLRADFIGLIQFSVYVGAVAVLIVFSLLITCRMDESEEIARRPKSLVTGLVCVLPVVCVLLHAVSTVHSPVVAEAKELPVEELGESLYTTYAPAVLAVAVLLTAVLIGAALFAREPKNHSSPSDL